MFKIRKGKIILILTLILINYGCGNRAIHGCPDELMRGKAESHGCIRMNNLDVVELFNLIEVGIKVLIEEWNLIISLNLWLYKTLKKESRNPKQIPNVPKNNFKTIDLVSVILIFEFVSDLVIRISDLATQS